MMKQEKEHSGIGQNFEAKKILDDILAENKDDLPQFNH